MKLHRRDLCIGLALLAACKRNGAEPPDREKILADLSALVIVPSYTAAANDTKELETALVRLRDAGNPDALSEAQAIWKKARRSWKVTDAFLLGPADDLALTGGIIDTAADAAKIDAHVAGTAPVDAVGSLGANMRGFGGIEVLLFAPAKDEARRGQFAAALGTDLRAKIDAVLAAWTSNYANQFSTAGRGSTIYTSERQGIDAVVNALIAAAEVLIAVRLAKPLGIDKTPAVPAPELVESPLSDASIDDVLAVIDGIEMVYFGKPGGLPLADAVAERSPQADAHMRDLVPKARDAVKAIAGPLRTAVVERRESVLAAHAAVREVKRCLSTEVAAALGTSVGFNVTDGD